MLEIKTLKAPVDLEIKLPASKSITNRALICAALAEGESVLRNVNLCTDVQVMIDALTSINIVVAPLLVLSKVEGVGAGPTTGAVKISGGFSKMHGSKITNLKNSGTATRFLTALACLISGETYVDDEKMRKRPMRPLVQALRELGAEIEGSELPLKIRGGSMRGGKVRLPASQSSQFISALLLVAPYFEEGLELELTEKSVSSDYIEITIQVMKDFGVEVTKLPYGFKVLSQKYEAREYEIEADASAATYFEAINFLTCSKITFSNFPQSSFQPDRNFESFLAELKNGAKEFDLSATPDLVPSLAVCAATLNCETKLQNIGHLRHKESDRI
ncbi:MAG: hypothetical protein PHU71_03865, partial [Candidatus Gracilibacteria bacterium]|nr:hypothetical protein [Candidatus Gracilibacteria bacterium]